MGNCTTNPYHKSQNSAIWRWPAGASGCWCEASALSTCASDLSYCFCVSGCYGAHEFLWCFISAHISDSHIMTTTIQFFFFCEWSGVLNNLGEGVVVVQFRLEEELELEEGGQEKRGMKMSCRPISER